jgi:hypothetical protein
MTSESLLARLALNVFRARLRFNLRYLGQGSSDIVSPGEVVALIDTSETMGELHQGQAAAALARQTVATRHAEVAIGRRGH